MSKQNIEVKHIGGVILDTKQEERNGVPVGLISGYIATWDKDRGDDKFIRGAFLDSIEAHKRRNNRQVRFKDNHWRTIGGFPINTVHEDEKGLFGIAEVNLDIQQGRELFSLAKQKVITDFSIGFNVVEFQIKDSTRLIEKANIWEGSATDEPMNIEANIIDVKSGLGITELETMDCKDIEEILRATGKFSRKACTIITSRFAKGQSESDEGNQSESGSELIAGFKKLNTILK